MSVMQQCLISTVMTIVYVLYKQGRLQVLWYDHEAWSTGSTACIGDSHLMTLSRYFETVGPFGHRHLIIIECEAREIMHLVASVNLSVCFFFALMAEPFDLRSHA